MSKGVIKYFLPLLLFSFPLISQEKNSISENGISTEIPANESAEKKSLREFYSSTGEIKNPEQYLGQIILYPNNENASKQTNPESSLFSILSSSYRSNIKFGGFWENYAIVNFIPSVALKPFSFINFYANHRHSCFIPMQGLREHFKSLFIQSAAILAIDNSVKLLFGSDEAIPLILGFAAKIIIINSVMNSINENKKNKIQDYRSYRYSVSIRL